MTQKQRLLEYLQSGLKLTRINAWAQLGILECPARLSELRRDGHKIRTDRKTVTNRYGEKVSVAVWSMDV